MKITFKLKMVKTSIKLHNKNQTERLGANQRDVYLKRFIIPNGSEVLADLVRVLRVCKRSGILSHSRTTQVYLSATMQVI